MKPELFPEHGTIEEKLKFWLGYAILAPSAHNNQPWKCVIEHHVLHVRIDTDYISSGALRLTVITLGEFVENFVRAAEHYGYACGVSGVPLVLSDPKELEILVTVHEAGSAAQAGLMEESFEGIEKRHTNRGLYRAELPHGAVEKFAALPLDAPARLFTIEDAAARERIADLTARGMKIALTMPQFRRELAEYVHYKSENSATGMWVEAMISDAEAGNSGADFILNRIDIDKESAFSREKFAGSPLHIVIGTDEDGPRAWFAAGRTLQRALNLAGSMGLTHCIAAAPVEVPTLTPLLRREIDPQYRPQMLFRVGMPQEESFTLASPRRTVENILK